MHANFWIHSTSNIILQCNNAAYNSELATKWSLYKLALHFRISVENAFLDEKEDACCALGELAGNAG